MVWGLKTKTFPASSCFAPGGYPIVSTQNWRSAFLPGAFQGTYIDTQYTEVEKLIANIHNKQMACRGTAQATRSRSRVERRTCPRQKP